jgi:hypothetical protein
MPATLMKTASSTLSTTAIRRSDPDISLCMHLDFKLGIALILGGLGRFWLFFCLGRIANGYIRKSRYELFLADILDS